MKSIIHSSLADFILFIYVHMSEADHNYDPREMDVIQQKMAKLFPDNTDFEKKLYGTIREYNNFDKAQLPSLFKNSFEHFRQELSSEQSVYSDLQEIVQADGEINPSEKDALDLLKRIIDLNSN